MNAETFEKYKRERYAREVGWYDKRASKSKMWYLILQWALVIASALTPVLIAIDFCAGRDTLKLIPLGTAVLVAILASALKTFQFEENWINYRTICESLKKEIHYYDSSTQEYSSTRDREALFVERVESLISRENTLWLTSRDSQMKTEKARQPERAD